MHPGGKTPLTLYIPKQFQGCHENPETLKIVVQVLKLRKKLSRYFYLIF